MIKESARAVQKLARAFLFFHVLALIVFFNIINDIGGHTQQTADI